MGLSSAFDDYDFGRKARAGRVSTSPGRSRSRLVIALAVVAVVFLAAFAAGWAARHHTASAAQLPPVQASTAAPASVVSVVPVSVPGTLGTVPKPVVHRHRAAAKHPAVSQPPATNNTFVPTPPVSSNPPANVGTPPTQAPPTQAPPTQAPPTQAPPSNPPPSTGNGGGGGGTGTGGGGG